MISRILMLLMIPFQIDRLRLRWNQLVVDVTSININPAYCHITTLNSAPIQYDVLAPD